MWPVPVWGRPAGPRARAGGGGAGAGAAGGAGGGGGGGPGGGGGGGGGGRAAGGGGGDAGGRGGVRGRAWGGGGEAADRSQRSPLPRSEGVAGKVTGRRMPTLARCRDRHRARQGSRRA